MAAGDASPGRGPAGGSAPRPVDVSVIVPAYRAEATLDSCLRAVLDQRFTGTFEVILSVSADRQQLLPQGLPSDPRLSVLSQVPRLRAAPARNRAAAVARGRLLVFTDADVVADPDWLACLVRASADGQLCVAGAVSNGTPDSAVGTAEYLVQFLDLSPARPVGTAWHGATCNLLVPRNLWERHGPFAEDLDGGEDTLLTVRLRREGRFVFSPDPRVVHRNRTSLRRMLANQRYAGRYTARLGRRSSYKLRPLVRVTPLAPAATLARVVSLSLRMLAWNRRIDRPMLTLPLALLGLSMWGWGLLCEGMSLDAAALTRRIERALGQRQP